MDEKRESEAEVGEVTAIRVEYGLVPEWSSIVERISADLGKVVQIVAEPRELVIRVEVTRDVKPRYIAELAKAWQLFSETRDRMGEPVHVKYTRHEE